MKKSTTFSIALVVGVALALLGARVSADKGAQHWEYKFIWIDMHDSDNLDWFENVSKRLPQPVNAFMKAQELGAQGWELVNAVTFEDSKESRSLNNTFVAYAPHSVAIQYVFKRPK